jgi:hypothetical protein
MLADENLLHEFERGLNPQRLTDSPIAANIIGYGEISAIFQLANISEVAFKRLPLFSDRPSAEKYTLRYCEYCNLLTEAGLHLPEHQTFIIEPHMRPVAVYIAQKRYPSICFAHQLIATLEPDKIWLLIETIVKEISKVQAFNTSHSPAVLLGLDGQLSNWVWPGNQNPAEMVYVDTSTPLFRKNGIEQLDPELFLKSVPVFLRWILRWLFVEDVINRYYDQRQVLIDLAANLYKEQRPDLLAVTVDMINQLALPQEPLTVAEVNRYYREDKLIWVLFLTFRRIDRWLTTKVLKRRYEFILPGRIKR